MTVENFFNAVHGKDTNTVSGMLEADSNLVHAVYYGRLPITVAAGDGSVEIVEQLLKRGADVNVQNDTWNTSNVRLTALEAAIWNGNTNLCKLLLEAGANPDLQSGFEGSALHYAFAYRRTEVAGWLLDYGADPFLKKDNAYNKATPFESAITQGDGKLVPRMLGQEGAGPAALKPARPLPWKNPPAENKKAAANIIAERGIQLLSAAAQRAELEAVEALLKAGVSVKTNVSGGMPVLQSVAIAEAPAIKAYPDALAQWQQTSNELKRLGTNANQWNLNFTRSRATEQAARVDATNPERWLKIRDLLIKNGADYDAFAATAMGDIQQTTKLLATDRSVVQACDRNGQTPLHWAVQNDQLPLTSFWLQAGASPAATNLAGQTPLHIAATKGLSEQVKVLLAASAPTDIRDTNGWTPLDAAIQAKQTDCIHLLMAKAPAVAHPERGLAGTLHEAAATGNIAALASLLETETNLEARNELGLTPLQVAGQAGQLGAAALLIDHGADVNARDPEGNTVLHQILLSRTHWVKGRPSDAWVERREKIPSQEKFWRVYNTPSGYTSPRELAASVAFFLACGTDPAATNHAGQTILQLVTADSTMLWDYDRNAILPLLQQTGNGLNARDAEGNTALHRLCTGFYDMSKVESMNSLIASGADVNATNNLGQTPLHVAAEKIGGWDGNNPPVNEPFQLLIYSKANVNAQDNQGLTPLDVVALSDSSFRRDATRALLDAGANPNLRDKQGRTPAHLFLSGKWAWSEAGECIDMLVAAGADLSAKDDQGKTPLHYLAVLGSQSPMFFIRGIGDTFILAKVDINARDNDGDTPLQLAAKTGTKDVYDWLVKQGASQDAANNAGETPRQQALRSTNVFSDFRFNPDTDIFQAIREGKLESVAAILKSSPDLLNQTNQFGQTPLLVAAQMRRTNIADFLDAHGVRWDPVSAILTGRTNVLHDLIAQQPHLAADASLLRLAAVNGNAPAVALLLGAGSDLKTTDAFGLSPLGDALAQEHQEVASLLKNRGAVENIFDAVFSGDTETAAALIDKDKSLALATNPAGVSVAEIAAATGKDRILKLLLDKGVSPNFHSTSTGKSLLYAAADYNQTNTAELLIQRRAKLNVADAAGFSPIHIAALNGSTGVLELLLQHKADFNLRTEPSDNPQQPGGSGPPFSNRRALAVSGNTALHLAAMTGQTNAIALLLKWGASINATNADGMTPLDLAGQIGQPPFLMMNRTDMRLPFTPPSFPRDNPMLRRGVTITLLEQAGGKHGERRGPAGMMPFGSPTMTRFPSMSGAPAPQAPVLQTGADYHAQGCADYNARRLTNALADFRKSCELGSDNQDYSYFRIWLIRARLGEKEAATQELAAYLEHRKAQNPDDWPSKVGRFLAGQLSESDFLKAADDPNLQTSKEQHCEAYFYVGSKHLIENDKMAAVDFFKKCLTTNVTNFEEYTSAATELLFLQLPPTNP